MPPRVFGPLGPKTLRGQSLRTQRFLAPLVITYIVLTTFWIAAAVAALCTIFDHRITFFYGILIIPSHLVFTSLVLKDLSHSRS